MTKTEIRRMVTAAAAACEEKKAERISILELDPADSGFTDYFLICSGTNERQNQAIATGIEETMKRDFGTYVNSVEGYRQGEWILLDYVDFVVHIFSNEKRDFYDIERLRKTATSLGLDELKASLAKRVSAVRKKQAAKKTASTKTLAKKPITKKPAAKKSALKKSSTKTAAKKAGGTALKGRAKPIAKMKKKIAPAKKSTGK
jgi:ribosome-associated protein